MKEKKNIIKGKEKKGELKLPLYQSLAMAPTCPQKQQNEKKKKRKKGAQPPPLLRPYDAAINTQKQQNKK